MENKKREMWPSDLPLPRSWERGRDKKERLLFQTFPSKFSSRKALPWQKFVQRRVNPFLKIGTIPDKEEFYMETWCYWSYTDSCRYPGLLLHAFGCLARGIVLLCSHELFEPLLQMWQEELSWAIAYIHRAPVHLIPQHNHSPSRSLLHTGFTALIVLLDCSHPIPYTSHLLILALSSPGWRRSSAVALADMHTQQSLGNWGHTRGDDTHPATCMASGRALSTTCGLHIVQETLAV